jgi:hypothetical protein
LLRGFFEHESTDQVDGSEKDKRQNCAAHCGKNRVRELQVRAQQRDGGAGSKETARVCDNDGNHSHQLPDETEPPTVNDLKQEDDDG